MELSEQVKDLIKKARIVDFSSWRPSHPPESIALFQKADDDRRYLTDEDFEAITQLAPKMTSHATIARQLRDQAAEIVDEARVKLLPQFPGILEPSQLGMHYMESLYGELNVPIAAMSQGLKELKTASLNRLSESDQVAIGPYFDHLILHLDHFDDD